MENKFETGKIYKIVCNKTGLCYIGSTIHPLNRRLSGHKYEYKRWLNDNNLKKVSLSDVLMNDDFKIILIEDWPCKSKLELHKRERFYIESIDCVNKYIPTQSDVEYFQKNKNTKIKEYRDQHKEYINEYQDKYNTLYYEKNKENIKNQAANYYNSNKDAIALKT